MDAISDPMVREVVVMSASQVGKTEALLNCIGFHIAHDPAPILVIQPTGTGGMADSFAKDRLAPMLRDTPALKGKVEDPRSRDSNNTWVRRTKGPWQSEKMVPKGRTTGAYRRAMRSTAASTTWRLTHNTQFEHQQAGRPYGAAADGARGSRANVGGSDAARADKTRARRAVAVIGRRGGVSRALHLKILARAYS